MRLMIVGSDRVDAIENFYVKHFRENGVDLSFFTAYTRFHEYYYHSLRNKLLFRLGISGIYRRINEEFRKGVEEHRPDLIWVFKGMEIFPESLQWARDKGIRLANYNPDNPFIFTGKGSGNGNVSRSIGLYDLHFTYNLAIKKQLQEEVNARTVLLPFGFEIDPQLFESCKGLEEVNKTCFLGNPDKQRASFLLALAKEDIQLDVYGRDWHKWLSHPNIQVFPPAYGNEMWRVLRKYRVQLNLMRIHNEDSHNMRTFEVPAIGGIMLAPDTFEHRTFFEAGKEIYLFRDVKDCAERARELISLSTSAADEIRHMTRERSIVSGYSYEDRTKQVMEQFRLLMA